MLRKLWKFGLSADFRGAKVRQWAWPLVTRLYPNLVYIGIQAPGQVATILPAHDRFITTDFLKHSRNFTPLEKALEILKQNSLDLGKLFLDVGSNLGTESIAAIRSGLFDRAIAIELSPENARIIRVNLAVSGLQDRVRLFQNGASNKAGLATIDRSETNSGDQSVALSSDTSAGNFVELKTVNQMLREANESPDNVSLIWMDVQGFEGFVLEGASEITRLGKPLVMEYSPRSLDKYGCHDSLIDQLRLSYRWMYDLDESKPLRRDVADLSSIRDSWQREREHTDFLFVRE